MNQRHLGLTLLLVVTSLLAVAPGYAAKHAPLCRSVVGTSQQAIVDPTKAVDSICPLGITGSPVYTVGYIVPPDDSYYTLIDPSDCQCSDSVTVLVSAAHIIVEFSYAYDVPVRVGIVQADLSNPECPIPIPGQYLCPPVEQLLEGPGYGTYDISLSLGTGCSVGEKSFLEITFTEWVYEVPGLVLTGSCEPCKSYNYYPGNNYDLCTFGFEGNPIMYVDATCASAAAVPEAAPSAAALIAMPNPASTSTVLRFRLSQGGPVTVEIFDVVGRWVATLVDGWLPAGGHTVVWDASRMQSGIYLCRLSAAEQRDTRRILVIR
jgi:hypothetical protein